MEATETGSPPPSLGSVTGGAEALAAGSTTAEPSSPEEGPKFRRGESETPSWTRINAATLPHDTWSALGWWGGVLDESEEPAVRTATSLMTGATEQSSKVQQRAGGTTTPGSWGAGPEGTREGEKDVAWDGNIDRCNMCKHMKMEEKQKNPDVQILGPDR